MIRVGITGGIGSGKSTVCELFEELGAPVYYSDGRARELMNSREEIRCAIVELLGDGAYRGDTLNNGYVAGRVFTDKGLLASLNAIVHPAVARDFEAWALSFVRLPYLILESAILFESGFDKLVDRIVTVSAPEALRIERVVVRAGGATSREDATRRMANQMTDAEREARADRRIENSGSREELAAQVQLLDKEFKQ